MTIDRCPREIWPWLIQMGCRRAGWYSYDGLDNGGAPSAERIIPELQAAAVGDVFPMTPIAQDAFVVRAVEVERALVLGDATGSATWAFVLAPISETRTRVLVRVRAGYDRLALGLMLKLVWRPIHFGMQRRQLLNLKRLAEGRYASGSRGRAAKTLRLLVGSGDKITLSVVPFLTVGLVLNVAYPAAFHVGGPPEPLRVASIVVLAAGVVMWIWSAVLIVAKVPRGELIRPGPSGWSSTRCTAGWPCWCSRGWAF